MCMDGETFRFPKQANTPPFDSCQRVAQFYKMILDQQTCLLKTKDFSNTPEKQFNIIYCENFA